MVSFVDGPAQDQVLALQRAPMYLRVVQDGDQFDALDQLDDRPEPGEIIHVYERVSIGSPAHVCYRGRNRRLSGWYQIATYRHVADIDGDQVRETQAWREWVEQYHAAQQAA